MNIFFNEDFKIVCQGFTGNSATYHIRKSIDYKTNVVCGVTPGKGGKVHLGLPVFDTVKEAVMKTCVNTSVIFVPAPSCKDAIIEAIDAGIRLIVCITEGIPSLDFLCVKKYSLNKNVRIIGPNSPGFIIPNFCRIGIMPCDINLEGRVGIVSRSGTLTYEAIKCTSELGLGQSISIGIGGDPIVGSSFIDILSLLNEDLRTEVILMIGELGGSAEEEAGYFIKKNINKPVIAYISGINAPIGKKMGHAGAIENMGIGGVAGKIAILKECGVKVIDSIIDIGKAFEL
ncbi:MAG TPA: succinate--CoA ligase subunit alpha [Candidatus Azoamicus sp. OHIO1]